MLADPQSFVPLQIHIELKPTQRLLMLANIAEKTLGRACSPLNPSPHHPRTRPAVDFTYSVGLCSEIGRKSVMEDRSISGSIFVGKEEREVAIFAVFDGHRGHIAADYLAENLLSVLSKNARVFDDWKRILADTICDLESSLHEMAKSTISTEDIASSGSTLICLIIDGHQMIVCNVGDSRCILSRNGHIILMSADHKYFVHDDERGRIDKMGIQVDSDGYFIGDIPIPITRALGDYRYSPFNKVDGLLAEGEVIVDTISGNMEFALLSSDGIFDTMTDMCVMSFLRQRLSKGMSPDDVCKELVEHSIFLGATDNLTAMVVLFKHKSSGNPLISYGLGEQ